MFRLGDVKGFKRMIVKRVTERQCVAYDECGEKKYLKKFADILLNNKEMYSRRAPLQKFNEMIADFDHQRVTNIVFGKGKVKEKLGSLLKEYGATRVLLTYGRSSIKKLGIYDECVKIMKDMGIEFWELSGIRPNPEVSKAREGIKMVKEHKIDFILAAGGGSVVDLSKAISFGHGYDGDVWEIVENFFKRKEEKKNIKVTKFLPLGVILTLSATGTEMNGGAVISNDETGHKLFAIMKGCVPKFSILDPEYTYSVSAYQTTAGSVDMLSHCLEIYFADDTPFLTNRICEAVIMAILKYTPIAVKDPKNYEARSNLMWSSTVALSGFTQNGSSGGDFSNHSLEHECAAIYPELTHGIGLAISHMGHYRYICEKRPERFVSLGKNCFKMDEKEAEDPKKVVDWLENWFLSIGCPVYFHDDEATKTWTHEDSVKAAETRIAHYGDTVGSYVKLNKDDMIKILDSRIKKE